jgi:DNA modification methylase
VTLHHGDCLDVMAAMEPESVDAIVTDPPYGLEFMGKKWDKLDAGLPQEAVWKGRRGQGGSSIGTDDSKPQSRHHVGYGGGQQGFKRCTTCGKRAFSGSPCQCAEPTYVIEYNQTAPSASLRMGRWHQQWAEAAYRVAKPSAYLLAFGGTRTVHRMTVALEDAGWIIRDMLVWGYASGFPKSKASLKPAWEPIVMARKPGPLRMLAIDECRIPMSSEDAETIRSAGGFMQAGWEKPATGIYGTNSADHPMPTIDATPSPLGRWPANVILTDPIFDGGVEGVVGGGEARPSGLYEKGVQGLEHPPSVVTWGVERDASAQYGDSGTYSRFFLVPKADRSDREPITKAATTYAAAASMDGAPQLDAPSPALARARYNVHPTVKPTDLMRHLVRLVTPTGGTVLDPFLGSGTTALAAEMEGFQWIGIEREAEYCAIAEARLNGTQRGLGLETA